MLQLRQKEHVLAGKNSIELWNFYLSSVFGGRISNPSSSPSLGPWAQLLDTRKDFMTDYSYLTSKNISLIVWNADDETDVRVFLGEIIYKDNEYHFINLSKNWDISLDLEKLSRIKEVSEDMKATLLDADYCLSVTLGTLPNDSTEGLTPTGLKWS